MGFLAAFPEGQDVFVLDEQQVVERPIWTVDGFIFTGLAASDFPIDNGLVVERLQVPNRLIRRRPPQVRHLQIHPAQ